MWVFGFELVEQSSKWEQYAVSVIKPSKLKSSDDLISAIEKMRCEAATKLARNLGSVPVMKKISKSDHLNPKLIHSYRLSK